MVPSGRVSVTWLVTCSQASSRPCRSYVRPLDMLHGLRNVTTPSLADHRRMWSPGMSLKSRNLPVGCQRGPSVKRNPVRSFSNWTLTWVCLGKNGAHRTTAGTGETRCPASARGGRAPRRRRQPALAVARERDRRVTRVEFPVPELAGDLLVALVEALAVVRELAPAHELAVARADLPEPIGIGERLPRRRDEVGLAALEDPLRLLEGRDAAARHDGRRVAGLATPVVTDRGGERDVAAERAACVGEHG